MPVVYVDAVPVRVDVRGEVTHVGLLLRVASDGTISRMVISGRVLYRERIRDALMRNLEKDLGPVALPRVPPSPAPFTVVEYFPDPSVTGFHDPRQHAVSLAFVVPVDGECRPSQHALDLAWLTPRRRSLSTSGRDDRRSRPAHPPRPVPRRRPALTMAGSNSTEPDVVVVGAGSAGAALAARLSEDPDLTVLLSKAGPTSGVGYPGRGAGPNFFRRVEPGRLWPQLLARRTPARQGGSTYGDGESGARRQSTRCGIRGTVDDYDRWAEQLGCPGWGWAEMLETFRSIEDDVDHGGDGSTAGRSDPARGSPSQLCPFEGRCATR